MYWVRLLLNPKWQIIIVFCQPTSNSFSTDCIEYVYEAETVEKIYCGLYIFLRIANLQSILLNGLI